MKKRHLWLTKNGDALWVDELTDSHLINSYKMLVRMSIELSQASNNAWSMSFQGEMAQYYQDQAIDEMTEKSEQIEFEKKILWDEIQKRGLKF